MSSELQYTPEEARAILEEYRKRSGNAAKSSGDRPYMKGLFGPQRDFVLDDAKKKTALCGRRAGKTEGVAAWLLDGAEDAPGEMSVYVALRRIQARNVLWLTLQRIERRYDLGLRFREIDKQLQVSHPNGHTIWLAGCDDFAEIDKFRGARYKRAAIDEAASYGEYLVELVEGALLPALEDLQGQIALCGTPGPVLGGYFYDVTTGENPEVPKWPVHHWTMDDNPHMPRSCEDIRDERGWEPNYAYYLREYKGLWVYDADALVFGFDGRKNSFSELPDPDGEWAYVLGVDLGWHDDTAFSLLGTRRGLPEVYVIKSWKRKHLIVSAVAAFIEQVRRDYPLQRVVMDTAAGGRQIAEELKKSFGVPVHPALKKDKMPATMLLQGALKSGQLKVNPRENRELLSEWAILQWNEDRSDLDPRCPNDLSDATQYAFQALHVSYIPKMNKAVYGTSEYWEEQDRQMLEQHRARVFARKPHWWERRLQR